MSRGRNFRPSESDGSMLNSRLSIGTEAGGLYRVYPSRSHWLLIGENMAADPLVKLCRLEKGVDKAIELANKYIGENE